MNNTITTIKVNGHEAISYLTCHVFTGKSVGPKAGGARIIEHRTGIDIDNAGRYYDHESEIKYTDLLWDVLNYLPTKHSVDDYYSAEVEPGKQVGGTTGVLRSFSIHTDLDDSESRGYHYEFQWPTDEYVPAFEVSEFDEVDVSADTDGEYDWRTVSHLRYIPGDSGRDEDFTIQFEDEDENVVLSVKYGDRVRVRHYR